MRITKFLLLLLISSGVFAQKISQMPSATTLSGTELVPIIQGGYNKKTTLYDVANLRQFNVKNYGASGSAQSTTGSVTASSYTVTVASAIDFKVGQYIAIKGASNVTYAQFHVSRIVAIAGTTVTMANPATVTVSNVVVKHCDQKPIRDAVEAAKAAGGGVVYFPNGYYRQCSTPVASGANKYYHITIPLTEGNVGADGWSTIAFEGETMTAYEYQFAAQFTTGFSVSRNGVVIASDYEDNGILGSAIMGTPAGTVDVPQYQGFNYTNVYLNNIAFYVKNIADGGTPFVTNMSGVDFKDLASPLDIPDPTGSGTFGLRMPGTGNHGLNEIGVAVATGFETGFDITEHCSVGHLIAACNVNAVKITTGYAISIQHLTTEGNQHNIAFTTNSAHVWIGAWSGENKTSGTAWYKTVKDIRSLVGTPTDQSVTVCKTTIHLEGGGRSQVTADAGIHVSVDQDEFGVSHRFNVWSTGGRPAPLGEAIIGYNETTGKLEIKLKDGTLKTFTAD
ncbi:MAG: hypothetical protein V4615_04905 [Bacteroidota bacterium]